MKTLSLILMLILLMAGAAPAYAQYGPGQGYVCYACPVCGTVFSLTPQEAASANPYDLCPACYMAYLYAFVQVPCQAVQGYDRSGSNVPGNNNQPGYNQPGYNLSEYSLPEEEDEGQSAPSSDGQQPGTSAAGLKRPAAQETSERETASAGKILMVLAPQDYQEDELNVPRDYFQSNGYEVTLASSGVKTATGMSGGNVSVDADIDEVDPSMFEAVVFVGGEGIYYLKLNEDPDYTGLARKAASENKLVAAICLAPWILADAGLLQGKEATAAETDHIKSKGAVISDQPVVVDGNIITANGPDAAQEFAKAVVTALEGSAPKLASGNGQGISREETASALRVPLGGPEAETDSSSSQAGESSPVYRCAKCGYVYDPAVGDLDNGIEPGTPFSELPSGWKCPWCDAGKGQFVEG